MGKISGANHLFISVSGLLQGRLFNMAIHSLGMPGMEAANNIGRLLVLLIALFALGDSLLLVATIFSIVLLAGELWTATKVMLRINSNG